MSKEDLKDVFSVMYDVALSNISSIICFVAGTMGGWICFIRIRAELSPSSRRAWDGHGSLGMMQGPGGWGLRGTEEVPCSWSYAPSRTVAAADK